MLKLYHTALQQPSQNTSTKFCLQCQTEKPLNQFYTEKSSKDGYRNHCKKCFMLRSKKVIAIQLPLFAFSKICSKCGIEKPLDQFYPQPNGLFGCRANCKQCGNKRTRERQLEIASGEVIQVTSKVCSSCKQEKAMSEFGNSRVTPDRHTARCKKCLNKYNRHYYDTHRTQLNAYHRAWSTIPEVHERRRDYGRMYDRTHYPEKLAKRRHLRATDPAYREHESQWHAERLVLKRDEMLATQRRWRKENALRVREYGRRHHAQRRSPRVDKINYVRVLQQNDGYCYICAKHILPHHKIEFDHIIPLDRHGPHIESNIAVTHACCNRRKYNKLLSEMTAHQRRGPDDLPPNTQVQ